MGVYFSFFQIKRPTQDILTNLQTDVIKRYGCQNIMCENFCYITNTNLTGFIYIPNISISTYTPITSLVHKSPLKKRHRKLITHRFDQNYDLKLKKWLTGILFTLLTILSMSTFQETNSHVTSAKIKKVTQLQEAWCVTFCPSLKNPLGKKLHQITPPMLILKIPLIKLAWKWKPV